jgi:2-polyprenyl-3-methyl-5-hydroxy-6-metoxy-1,4-benzoquinol methylase
MHDAAACPLCRSVAQHEEAATDGAAIRDYWRGFAYNVDAEFPAFPDRVTRLRCARCGLGWFRPALIGGPALYAALAAWPPYYRDQAWEWPLAIKILRTANVRTLIEVGAGCGAFLSQAAPHFAQVRGLEFNEAAIRVARSKGLAVENLPLSEIAGDAEAIVAFQLLEHLADPAEFIMSCRDRLGRGGLLVVAVPNDDGAVGALSGDFLNLPPHHATRWRRSSLEAIAGLFGLTLVDYRVEPLSYALARLYRRRRLKAAHAPLVKLLNAWRRLMIEATLPLTYRRDRRRLGGETHLAVFRKP